MLQKIFLCSWVLMLLSNGLVVLTRINRQRRAPNLRVFSEALPTFKFSTSDVEAMIDRSDIIWKSQYLPLSPPLTLQYAEAQKGDEIMDFCISNNLPEAFGIVSWESSIAVLPHLKSKVESLKSIKNDGPVTVCDVGCGTGLVSVAALAFGATHVVALDYNIFSLQYAKRTFAKNFEQIRKNSCSSLSEDSIQFKHFDLSDFSSDLPFADLYVYSDVLYTEELAEIVAKRVKHTIDNVSLSTTTRKYFLVSDPKRSTAKYFIKELGFASSPTDISEITNSHSFVCKNLRMKCIENSNYQIFDLESLAI